MYMCDCLHKDIPKKCYINNFIAGIAVSADVVQKESENEMTA